jgi:hypothetical protein
MRTDADRLRFAVRFAEERLDHYRPGDWLNLRDDLSGFFGTLLVGGVRILLEVGSLMAAAKDLPEAKIREVQAQVAVFLKSLATEKVGEMTFTIDGVPAKGTARWWTTRDVTMTVKWTFERWPTVTTATLREAMLLRLIFLVARHGQEDIKACPECGRLFWRVRRQLYCSRTCVNRVNMRTWKATRKGKAWRRRQAKPHSKKGR